MSSANLVAESLLKLSNQRTFSTGKCNCEYINLLQSFHGGALSIHLYISQKFYFCDKIRRAHAVLARSKT